jgi:hypothetical protein
MTAGAPFVAADGSMFLWARVAEYNPRTGEGAVIREDTGARLDLRYFFADQKLSPLTPGEQVHCELSPGGEVINLIRMH